MTTSPPWQGISYVEDKRGKWWYEEGYGVRVYDGASWLGKVAGGSDYPWCELGRLDTQTITTGTFTAIIWDAELNDPHNMHDNTTNPSRITATEDGVYAVSAHIQWTYIPSSGYRFLYLVRNGATTYPRFVTNYYTTNDITNPHQSLSGQFNLNAGQYVEAYVYHNRGSDLTLDRLAWSHPIITVAKICEL